MFNLMLKEGFLLCRVFYGNLIINVSIAKFEGLLNGQFQEKYISEGFRIHSLGGEGVGESQFGRGD